MLEDLDSLTAKLTEVATQVRSLRDENQQLRSRLGEANSELDALRAKVGLALQRIDGVLDHLPPQSGESKPAA